MVTHSLNPLHCYPSNHIHIPCYHQFMHTPVNMRAICRSEEVKNSSLYLAADHTILVNGVVDVGEGPAKERVFEEEDSAGLVGELRAKGCCEVDCYSRARFWVRSRRCHDS